MSTHEKKLFALDIGTRSCVGIILEEKDQQYAVADVLSLEHEERAMLDGQIHDVPAVAKLISKIKTTLETKHGPLHKVCVAAAGRALKTERETVTWPIQGKPLLTKEDILHLELLAVQQAQSKVAEKQHNEANSQYYYCVGYSVLYYRLDGEEIGSLIDQQGEVASVEIIATFLPKVVVESLLAALARADLEMEALTLEPIAAINVLVPSSMRRLNVALVDIGAGTSDIAITDMGTVIAYGMVPVAGDEITEAISDQLLLDFPQAEKAKRDLYTHAEVVVTDILGFEATYERNTIIDQISPSLHRLAEAISQEIFLLNNHRAPKAVMLVGGGSLTPELPKLLAEKLQLPANRVAIRGVDAIGQLTVGEQVQKGPELVTPIGIALAAKESPIQYVTVYVNNQPTRLFEMKELTVGDCLLTAGMKMNKLYGRPGLALMVTVNGREVTIPGQYGEPPLLQKNGHACSFVDQVTNGDQISVQQGEDGQKACITAAELLDDIPVKQVRINETSYTIKPVFTCNGLTIESQYQIQDRDQIEVQFPTSIGELFDFLQMPEYKKQVQPFRLVVNGKETILPSLSGKLKKNGEDVKLSASYADGDELIVEPLKPLTVEEFANKKQYMLWQTLPIRFDGKEVLLTKELTVISRGENRLQADDVLYSGDHITIVHQHISPFIFQDIFKEIEIEMPVGSDGSFLLLKNNEETRFDEELDPFDELKILWTKKAKKRG